MRAALAVGLASAFIRFASQPIDAGQLPNAISGRVLDPSGSPVPGAAVTLMRREQRRGKLEYHLVDARLLEITDANGAYRIVDASLGNYIVVAIPCNPTVKNGAINRTGFAITYYPSAADAASARPVIVNTAAPMTADITLRPAALPVVMGTVIGSDGAPVTAGTLHIAHGDHLFGIDGREMRIRPDGSFVLPGLSPGTYFLQYRESRRPPPRGDTPALSQASVTIHETDVANVKVVPIHMVKATGRVIIDPVQRRDFAGSECSIGATPADFDGNPGPAHPGRVRDDLTFEFASWPGPHYVFLDQARWRIKAIRLKGVDITDQPIDFKEGAPVSGIEVELARR